MFSAVSASKKATQKKRWKLKSETSGGHGVKMNIYHTVGKCEDWHALSRRTAQAIWKQRNVNFTGRVKIIDFSDQP